MTQADESEFPQLRLVGCYLPARACARDAVPEPGTARGGRRHHLQPASQRGRGRTHQQRRHLRQRDQRHLYGRPHVLDLRAVRPAARDQAAAEGRQHHRPAAVREHALVHRAARQLAAHPRLHRRLDLPVAPDAERGRPRHGLRQVEGQAPHRGAWPRHLRGRRRRRRGQGGLAGDRRVPARSAEIPAARRPHPARRASSSARPAPARR